PPPNPEELAREKLLLWEKTPPQTPEEFSARYAALTDLARSRFNLPLSLSAQEFVAHVNRTEIAALFEKAQKAKFAHIPPNPAEYQADLLTVKSLYWSS
ncbi:MAG: hypothetical protein KDK48_03310, partial [Chlamydiia bacterium]|nr:hypothetical protein [Chlamydiia bacterium]